MLLPRSFLCFLVFLLVEGCAVAPYEQSFQCPLASDFGTCTDVTGAYSDAVAAGARRDAAFDGGVARTVARSLQRGRTGEGWVVAQLAPSPQLPSVTPPTLLRTWIRGYEDGDRALFDARYVFHLAGESTITGADVAPAALQPAPVPVLPLPTAAP